MAKILSQSTSDRPHRRPTSSALRTRKRKELPADGQRTGSDLAFPVAEIFESEARARPDAPAVISNGNSLSYGELNARANQLAHHLGGAEVRNGSTVAVCLDRSVDLIIAIVAILKAGAAYAPLGLRSPPDRLASMLEDLQPPVVITRERYRRQLEAALDRSGRHSNARLMCIDQDERLIARQCAKNPGLAVWAHDVAYICFTSGSTGRPKGVCVPHRGIVRLVRNNPYAEFTSTEVFLQLSPASFDASLFEIWGSLLNGARLVLAPPHLLTLTEISEIIRKNSITTAWFTTGLFNQLVEEVPEALSPLNQALTGGEAASPFHIKRALGFMRNGRLINGYGPTESTTFATTYTVPQDFDGKKSVPIGRPIANTSCYILDDNLERVSPGEPGELHIGGAGLALGYLNRPERTAQRFIANPFEAGTRLYRTGDKVRYLEDGNIEFLGRRDQQVKIRGFRVEPGEVESKLLEHPAVHQCAVVARDDAAGLKQLIAYVLADGAPHEAVAELPQFLRSRVPDYMVPAGFIRLRRMPLTPNGKVDYKALPTPQTCVAQGRDRAETPNDATEAELQKMWSALLGVPSVGLNDNFFVLGGHSLLAMRLAAEIEKQFGTSVSVSCVLENPTIGEMADIIRGQSRRSSSIIKIQPNGSRPPLMLVHGAGGGMLWGYSNLARHLGEDQPVLAFKSRGLDGDQEPESIEELAAGYVEELCRLQPQGEYYLGGYCFGGLVAYEMARLLERGGKSIALLALINTCAPNSGYNRFLWRPTSLAKFAMNVLRKSLYALPSVRRQWREFFKWRGRLILRTAASLLRPARTNQAQDSERWHDLSSYPKRQQELWRAHIRAWTSYQPKPYGGRITLFRSTVHQSFSSFDPAYGWNEFARGGVDVKLIPSGHDTIMQEPAVTKLAGAVRATLQKAKD